MGSAWESEILRDVWYLALPGRELPRGQILGKRLLGAGKGVRNEWHLTKSRFCVGHGLERNSAESFMELLEQHQSGYSLPQAFYVEPHIFNADLDRIYRRHWLLAGPTCRVARAGDYFTYQIANDSIFFSLMAGTVAP